jgi:hypothetical protein
MKFRFVTRRSRLLRRALVTLAALAMPAMLAAACGGNSSGGGGLYGGEHRPHPDERRRRPGGVRLSGLVGGSFVPVAEVLRERQDAPGVILWDAVG